jgi:hypothetical protein
MNQTEERAPFGLRPSNASVTLRVFARMPWKSAAMSMTLRESGVWHRHAGGLILDPDQGFSFDPWPETESTLE